MNTDTITLVKIISDQCSSLTATTAPSVTALGYRMVMALATIMMVWFGVQEALASVHGGPGFSMAKFLNFFMLITFAYCFVTFYDSAIPGIGFSLKGFIDGGTSNLVQLIANDSSNQMYKTIDDATKQVAAPVTVNLYVIAIYVIVQVLLAVLKASISGILAYGVVAAAIVGLLGPVFIPFLVIDKLDWLFWGWLRAYLGFSFYKVVAAAAMNIMGNLLTEYLMNDLGIGDPAGVIAAMPFIILLVGVNLIIILKIPAITHSLFSGSTAGHDGGLSAAIMAIRATM
jgi:type IV secretory pathway VirB6-like protein